LWLRVLRQDGRVADGVMETKVVFGDSVTLAVGSGMERKVVVSRDVMAGRETVGSDVAASSSSSCGRGFGVASAKAEKRRASAMRMVNGELCRSNVERYETGYEMVGSTEQRATLRCHDSTKRLDGTRASCRRSLLIDLC
jgi:hypothetical protein